jgi:hypothetical protein
MAGALRKIGTGSSGAWEEVLRSAAPALAGPHVAYPDAHFTPTSGSWLNVVEIFSGSSPVRRSLGVRLTSVKDLNARDSSAQMRALSSKTPKVMCLHKIASRKPRTPSDLTMQLIKPSCAHHLRESGQGTSFARH